MRDERGWPLRLFSRQPLARPLHAALAHPLVQTRLLALPRFGNRPKGCLRVGINLLGMGLPLLALDRVFGDRLKDLRDGLARDRRPPAQAAKSGALRPALLRQAAEFGMAHGNRRQIKPVGLDKPAGLRMALAVARRRHQRSCVHLQTRSGSRPSLTSDHVRDPTAAGSVVSLRRLFDIRHVNALATELELSFDRVGLTVIYGDNGSGKSGYARILKNACRARTTGRENILANIYDANPGDASAFIEFTVNGQNRTAQWEYSKPPDPMLSAVSVFDARTASIHVDQANDVAYTPPPLRILAALAQACQLVRQRLNLQVGTLQRQVPAAISNPSCKPDTRVGKLLADLRVPGATEAVEQLATLGVAESERLIQLTADLVADPAQLSRQLMALKSKVEGYLSGWKF